MTNKGVTSSGLTDTPCLSTIGVETCSGSSQVENVPKENEELRRLTELNEQLAKEMLELQAENKKIKEEREIREKMEIEMHVNLLMEIREKDEQLTGMKKNEENLLNQILGLEREKKRAEKRCLDMKRDAENHEKNTVKRILGKVFTPGQIKVLLSENRARIRWSAEDISSALALRAKSGLAYKYLREVIHIPLPCETVLRDWTANFKVPPGILHSVLGIMK
ncbi:PREDICTED: uncharacterized protein LOC108783259, partial [Cyphomyrmex costatus]|uniref:uncharacterized protein LOC108783259 n=1 Tax=Cyphomyrmex costatus TaxID=456900 RepID=UPI00085237A2